MQRLNHLHTTGWKQARHRWSALCVALIAIAGAVVYSNSFNVQFIMDDHPVISLYGPMELLEIILHGGMRRTADVTFSLNHHLHGTEVTGYHLVNLIIHNAAAITLYFFTGTSLGVLLANREQTPERSVFIERFMPLAVALLFVTHPVQTQAVTYIVQRYTSLATLFYLLSALFFIKFRLSRNEGDGPRRTGLLACACLISGILAVTSKQIAFTLPLMLIFLELFLFNGRMLNRTFYAVCGTLLFTVLAATLATWHDRPLADFLTSIDHATSEDNLTSRWTYFLTQTRVVAAYLGLLCLPVGQSIFHEVPEYTTLFSLPVICSMILHISLAAAAVVFYRISKRHLTIGNKNYGALLRITALGITWFYVSMLVESSIFPITDVMFEHRIYLPSAGFFLAVLSCLALIAERYRHLTSAVWVLFVLVSITFGGMTLARNHIWSDSMRLWQDTATKAPNKDLVLTNLAGEYMKQNMHHKALPLFVKALETSPYYMTTTKVYLGLTLQYLDIDGSRFTTGEEIVNIRELKGRAELGKADEFKLQSVMYNNLGLAHEFLGNPTKSKEHYRSALKYNPDYDLAWFNLGLLAAAEGDKGLGISALTQLKRLKSPQEQHLLKILVAPPTTPKTPKT